MVKLSVIIPTYNRSADLPRLFKSLKNQDEIPDEILIILGPGDKESYIIAKDWQKSLAQIKILNSGKASVIHSINLGLANVSNEIICLLDDDVALPPDWSFKISKAFSEDIKLGAFGGRDHLQHASADLSNPPLAKEVGVFRWNGHKGYHHCGSQKSPIRVDVIKGVNLSFRKAAFINMEIDATLQGQGAETCWEIDICQRIIIAGYNCVYDNDNYVLHFWSPRLGFDNRTDVFAPAWPKRVFNEAFVMAKFRPLTEFFVWIGRLFLVGSRFQPGIIWSFLLINKHGIKVLTLPWRNMIFIKNGAITGFKKRQVAKYH